MPCGICHLAIFTQHTAYAAWHKGLHGSRIVLRLCRRGEKSCHKGGGYLLFRSSDLGGGHWSKISSRPRPQETQVNPCSSQLAALENLCWHHAHDVTGSLCRPNEILRTVSLSHYNIKLANVATEFGYLLDCCVGRVPSPQYPDKISYKLLRLCVGSQRSARKVSLNCTSAACRQIHA